MKLEFSSPPLQNYLLKSTANISELHECVSKVLVAHRVKRASEPRKNTQAVFHHAPLPNSSFNYLAYGVETRIDVSQLGFFLLEIPLSGKSVTSNGSGEIVSSLGSAVIAGPYNPFSTEWSEDCSKLLIKIERNAFENYLSTLLRRKQFRILDFDMLIDLNSNAGHSLWRIIVWIVSELEDQESLLNNQPLTGINCEQALMWCLLHTQPNNYSDELAELAPPTVPVFVKKTKQHIQKHYAEPIDLEELVNVSMVSERLLLDGFRQYLGISPIKYLRLVRLENAHLSLKEQNPDESNVTDIAFSSGFTQLGKFSIDYKKRFGESPSQTLKTISPLRESHKRV